MARKSPVSPDPADGVNPIVRLIDRAKRHPVVLILGTVTALMGWFLMVHTDGPRLVRIIFGWFSGPTISTTGRVELVEPGETKTLRGNQSFKRVVVRGGTLRLEADAAIIADRIEIRDGGKIEGNPVRIVAGELIGDGATGEEAAQILAPNGGEIELVAQSISGVALVADGKVGEKGDDMEVSAGGFVPRVRPATKGRKGGRGGTVEVFFGSFEGGEISVNGGEGGTGGSILKGGRETDGSDGEVGVVTRTEIKDFSQVFFPDDAFQTLQRAKIHAIEAAPKALEKVPIPP